MRNIRTHPGSCAEMAAVGFGLQQDSFSSLMENGPHLLAPTGSDVSTIPSFTMWPFPVCRTMGALHSLAPPTFTLHIIDWPFPLQVSQFCEVGSILAGFHNDLNLLTIHGKSRYPVRA